MAAGLPVVATNVGGLSEVVKPGEAGWLVALKDVVGLAKAISHLLTDDTVRAAFGRAGRRRGERQFSVSATVQQHQECFSGSWTGIKVSLITPLTQSPRNFFPFLVHEQLKNPR